MKNEAMEKMSNMINLWTKTQAKYPELLTWKLDLGYGKSRLGVCTPKKKTIRISKYLIIHESQEQINDTLLHEIAHALEWERHKTHGHGRRWQLIAIEVGAKPNRCASTEVIATLETKYTYECSKCHERTNVNRRLRLERRHCSICKTPLKDFKIIQRW